jgi:hypothetical protein
MKKLSSLLPDTIPEASDTDDVHRVITTVHGIENTVLIHSILRRCDP